MDGPEPGQKVRSLTAFSPVSGPLARAPESVPALEWVMAVESGLAQAEAPDSETVTESGSETDLESESGLEPRAGQ